MIKPSSTITSDAIGVTMLALLAMLAAAMTMATLLHQPDRKRTDPPTLERSNHADPLPPSPRALGRGRLPHRFPELLSQVLSYLGARPRVSAELAYRIIGVSS